MAVYGRTLLALMILESLEAGESGTTSDDFVTKARLVLVVVLALLIGVVRFT